MVLRNFQKKNLKELNLPEKECEKCKRDIFNYSENHYQIILGRFTQTSQCYFDCKNKYFILAVNKWSLFKNDYYIYYVSKIPEYFIKFNSKLDPIFPFRVVLNKDDIIVNHNLTNSSELSNDEKLWLYGQQTLTLKNKKLLKNNFKYLLDNQTIFDRNTPKGLIPAGPTAIVHFEFLRELI